MNNNLSVVPETTLVYSWYIGTDPKFKILGRTYLAEERAKQLTDQQRNLSRNEEFKLAWLSSQNHRMGHLSNKKVKNHIKLLGLKMAAYRECEKSQRQFLTNAKNGESDQILLESLREFMTHAGRLALLTLGVDAKGVHTWMGSAHLKTRLLEGSKKGPAKIWHEDLSEAVTVLLPFLKDIAYAIMDRSQTHRDANPRDPACHHMSCEFNDFLIYMFKDKCANLTNRQKCQMAGCYLHSPKRSPPPIMPDKAIAITVK